MDEMAIERQPCRISLSRDPLQPLICCLAIRGE